MGCGASSASVRATTNQDIEEQLGDIDAAIAQVEAARARIRRASSEDEGPPRSRLEAGTTPCDNGQLVHGSRESYQGVPLLDVYRRIENEVHLIGAATGKARKESDKRLKEARGAPGLQARGALMSILATPAKDFSEFLADCPEYVDLPTFSFDQTNAIAGSYMLYRASELQGEIEKRGCGGRGGQLVAAPVRGDGDLGSGEGGVAASEDVDVNTLVQQIVAKRARPKAVVPLEPNGTLLGEDLERVLRFKAMWGRRGLGVTLMTVEHPALGDVALVQPLLAVAAMHRVFNWEDRVDPVFEALLQAGASPNARNSLNMTPLMLVASSLIDRLEACSHTDSASKAVSTAISAVRALLAAGADPAAVMHGFGGALSPESGPAALMVSHIRSTKVLLRRERYTVREAFDILRAELPPEHLDTLGPETIRLLDDFAELLLQPPSPAQPPGTSAVVQEAGPSAAADGVGQGSGTASATCAAGNEHPEGQEGQPRQKESQPGQPGEGGGGAGGGGEGEGRELHPKQLQWLQAQARVREITWHLAWPWTQAMSNIAWAVSQVTMLGSASERRAFLGELCLEAPFSLPPMSVVSVAQLREEGCIPRYSVPRVAEQGPRAGTEAEAAAGAGPATGPSFRPLPVSELPSGSVVVFVSHRWLGRGCPDDEQGNKLKQVLSVADHVSSHRGVPLELVHLWLDYSVVDQDNPMPGVQALPIYIACCEEFVYIEHGEYWQRAWCLTEQFMAWKLSKAEVKYALRPWAQEFRSESAHTRPPDPTFGKLAVEADRVALATMTSILRYD